MTQQIELKDAKQIYLAWKNKGDKALAILADGRRYYWLFGALFEKKSDLCNVRAGSMDAKTVLNAITEKGLKFVAYGSGDETHFAAPSGVSI